MAGIPRTGSAPRSALVFRHGPRAGALLWRPRPVEERSAAVRCAPLAEPPSRSFQPSPDPASPGRSWSTRRAQSASAAGTPTRKLRKVIAPSSSARSSTMARTPRLRK